MTQHKELIKKIAVSHKIDPNLVTGLVLVESSGNQYAWNPEPNYRYFWNVKTNRPFREVPPDEYRSKIAPADFPCLGGDRDNEWWGQQASWGLMQIMGALARELGFKGPYLTELTDPSINLELGCKHLRSLMNWANEDMESALAAYNGGKSGNKIRPFRNGLYARKVLATAAVINI